MRIRSSRRLAGGVGLAALACAGALALAAPAGAATTSYPAGGSDFAGDVDGWVGSDAACGPLNPLSLLCSAGHVHDPAVGNPDGSIATQVNVTLNVLSIWTGTGTWTSPAFTPQPGGAVTGASFAYDRRVDSGGGLDLTPTAVVDVALVDETAGTTTPILTDNLISTANGSFARREVALPAGAVVGGHSYRLRIATTMSSSLVGLLGQANTRFDNVALAVQTQAPDGGNGGDGGDGGNSPGVRVVRGPYGDAEIAAVLERFPVDAETGTGPDGSLIPLELCTIVGTSGPDRIDGTAGNDVICGLGGDDTITSSGGRDAVDGANGDDRLSGGIGGDLLLGLAGNDRLDGGGDGDRIGGGAGDDRIEAGNGADLATGASGNDAVGGEAGHDRLHGLAGDDRINGGPGNDRLAGGAGGDVLRGLSGNDRLAGGSGGDRLDGGSGRDVLGGGSGEDRILARDAVRDVAGGGSGRDRAVVDRGDRVTSVASVSRR